MEEKENMLIYVWKRNGAWIDQHMKELKDLCDQEAVETGVKKPWVEASLLDWQRTEVFFNVRTNSRYIFQYMLRTEMEEKIMKRIEEKMNEIMHKK